MNGLLAFFLASSLNAGAGEAPQAVAPNQAQQWFAQLSERVQNWLHVPETFADSVIIACGTVGLVVLALIANWLVRVVLVRLMHRLFRNAKVNWVDIFEKEKVFRRLSHFAAALVYTHLGYFVFCQTTALHDVLLTVVNVYIVIIVVGIAVALLNALHELAKETGFASGMPLGGVAQALKLVAIFIGGILILSIFLDRSPIYFLSGLGALSAVLLLVFKDALLGLVGGVMLAANRMVIVGDWIEMPKYGADGDVVEVTLTTVKVQNWDKTIVTVPCYSLISESFKNWRGMVEYGGRRVKRSIYIDMESIGFASEEQLVRWKKIELLKDYLAQKEKELTEANSRVNAAEGVLANRRMLTNIGTFRAYCLAYLRAHPQVSQSMLILVRQLASDEHGLPLELYFFSSDTRWVEYENLQSDVFDHLLAIIGEFGLHVYQQE